MAQLSEARHPVRESFFEVCPLSCRRNGEIPSTKLKVPEHGRRSISAVLRLEGTWTGVWMLCYSGVHICHNRSLRQ